MTLPAVRLAPVECTPPMVVTVAPLTWCAVRELEIRILFRAIRDAGSKSRRVPKRDRLAAREWVRQCAAEMVEYLDCNICPEEIDRFVQSGFTFPPVLMRWGRKPGSRNKRSGANDTI